MKKENIRAIYDVFDSKVDFLAKKSVNVSDSNFNNIIKNLYTPGPSFQYVFDITNRKFIYVSKDLENTLGVNPSDFEVKDYADSIHPEDLQHFVKCEEIAGHFLFHFIQKEDIPNYKVSYQIRLRNSNGKYNLFLRQSIALTVDKEYKLNTVFTNNSNISHITNQNNKKVSFIDIKDGMSYFNISSIEDLGNKQAQLEISGREIEILQLISEGFSSKEIANYLHISPDTVRTHRKNILNKTDFKNLTQAAIHYVREGLI